MSGRKPLELDKVQFEKLCAMQCTQAEIASWFEVDRGTLDAWCQRTYNAKFSVVYEDKRGRGKISLRRMQWHHAERNPIMAMFLGKNYLGQSDTPDTPPDAEALSKAKEILGGVESAID